MIRLVWILSVWIALLSAEVLSVDDPRYQWMDKAIEKEFSAYKARGITRAMLDATQKIDHTFWRFKVVKSQIYGPDCSARDFLVELLKRYDIPDVEFLFQIGGDGITQPIRCPGPILTAAKRKKLKNVIVYHPWFVGPAQLVSVFNQTEAHVAQLPWRDKIDQVFWRGVPSDIRYCEKEWMRIPRIYISYLSTQYPHEINAGLCDFCPRERILNHLQSKNIDLHRPFASIFEHMKYKYQICLDGNTCTCPGYEWRLLSNCVVFKQDASDIMWFYGQLEPWVHYIPVKQDLSDLLQQIDWARTHDREAERIAENGRAFARENILLEPLLLYCYKVLLKYASLQRFTPLPD